MGGWIRLGIVVLCVALTSSTAYAQAPSSSADQSGAETGISHVTGQIRAVELARTPRTPAAIQPKLSPPTDLLALLVTVVGVSALLAAGVVLLQIERQRR